MTTDDAHCVDDTEQINPHEYITTQTDVGKPDKPLRKCICYISQTFGVRATLFYFAPDWEKARLRNEWELKIRIDAEYDTIWTQTTSLHPETAAQILDEHGPWDEVLGSTDQSIETDTEQTEGQTDGR